MAAEIRPLFPVVKEYIARPQINYRGCRFWSRHRWWRRLAAWSVNLLADYSFK